MTYHSAPGIIKITQMPMQEIAKTIGDSFRVTLDEMKSRNRKRPVTTARQISMYFMYHSGRYTLKMVGDFFGRDHTTVIHSLNTVKDLMETEPDFFDMVEKMRKVSYVHYVPPTSKKAIEKVVDKVKEKRPHAIYSNKSPMGIASEFNQEN